MTPYNEVLSLLKIDAIFYGITTGKYYSSICLGTDYEGYINIKELCESSTTHIIDLFNSGLLELTEEELKGLCTEPADEFENHYEPCQSWIPIKQVTYRRRKKDI